MKITKELVQYTGQIKRKWTLENKVADSLQTDSSTYVTGTGASFITVLATKEELNPLKIP